MRKTLDWTVPGTRSEKVGERDCGKKFLITEMAADQAERWAIRALLAGGAKTDLGDQDPFDAGMAGIAAVGIKALFSIPWADAKPLLDEMMACVQYVSPQGVTTALLSGDACQIEDPHTFIKLRGKVFELHTGFSLPGAKSITP